MVSFFFSNPFYVLQGREIQTDKWKPFFFQRNNMNALIWRGWQGMCWLANIKSTLKFGFNLMLSGYNHGRKCIHLWYQISNLIPAELIFFTQILACVISSLGCRYIKEGGWSRKYLASLPNMSIYDNLGLGIIPDLLTKKKSPLTIWQFLSPLWNFSNGHFISDWNAKMLQDKARHKN